MLGLLRQYGVGATWATVGMLMCRDFSQWCEVQPKLLPGYVRKECSTYSLGSIVREYPRLFFARPLVEQILATPGQELATHTYSHFLCAEDGATREQFAADLACAQEMASELGVRYQSLVFPRNQIRKPFLAEVANAGIRVYRGNPDHWLYRDGHFSPGGLAGRAVRFADAWLPLSGQNVVQATVNDGLINVAASLFLRPWSRPSAMLESLRLHRLKQAMTVAAKSEGICHIWWHPHNFGVNIERNLAILETLLKHYRILRDRYGMDSATMSDAAQCDKHSSELAKPTH